MNSRSLVAHVLLLAGMVALYNGANAITREDRVDNGYGEDGFVPGQKLPGACYLYVEFHLATWEQMRLCSELINRCEATIRYYEQDTREGFDQGLKARLENEITKLKFDLQRTLWVMGEYDEIPAEDPWPSWKFDNKNFSRPTRFRWQFDPVAWAALGMSTVAVSAAAAAEARAVGNTELIKKLSAAEADLTKHVAQFYNETRRDMTIVTKAINSLQAEMDWNARAHEILEAAHIVRDYMEKELLLLGDLRRHFIHPTHAFAGLWELARTTTAWTGQWDPERYGSEAAWHEESHVFVLPVPASCKEVYERSEANVLGPGVHVPYRVKMEAETYSTAALYKPIPLIINQTEVEMGSIALFLDDVARTEKIKEEAAAWSNTTVFGNFIDTLKGGVEGVLGWVGDLSISAFGYFLTSWPVMLILAVIIGIVLLKAALTYKKRSPQIVQWVQRRRTAPTDTNAREAMPNAPPAYEMDERPYELPTGMRKM